MDSRTGLPVVGMVGGGQLARMTHQAAIALGQSLRVLALAPDDGAALVAADVQYGDHTDLAALRTFAKGCDVVTFDHEHVPNEHIRALTDEGVKLFPPAEALVHAQDKRVMRERLGELGAPNPAWRPVESPADLVAFGEETGWPVVLKAARGGYDGRGVWMVDDAGAAGELAATLLAGGTPLLVEERVALRRELAVQVARSPFGQVAAYPVVETVQRDGICVEVLAPAPDLPEEQAVAAQQLAIDLATALGVVGLLAVELFDTPSGLVVNELAMRPHNSGHWTIEGARTSQFEQHLRAVLDYPMGDTSLTAPVVVMANVLGGEPGGISLDERLHHLFAAEPGAKVHLYGKQVRPGRKIGHVTVLGNDLEDVRARAARAARWLQEGH
ncbi:MULTISPECIES: 5-(carboxyamino)imidazole ribonucleotide synthase [Micromonospora]|uniref:N5-carboxyaminoimidazole ribonucleotide synthase n=1 Tax=Micromonospora chalcea TaxID=1874 RepID=A0ABX9Y387_MICCH|nr:MULTISPECIES: 5-(carboxyamino)imidazole ribonucleotide synthase [Micromonospora]ODB81018.1 5-(carboxyamino)imidazole ribonucleotide synthase [Micromonospora sp. II]RQW92448.1 5-(carboxyamino)imidazole ribonucleotide synthase [Micromonospora chalcea]RQX59865.1 5-(carboxyamino)imidazole ribonucleotide synthase [Micromonospora chalcea]